MEEQLDQGIEITSQATSDFDSLQDEVEFNPEEALRLQKKHELVEGYITRLAEASGNEEFANDCREIAESASDILLDPESLKALRKKRIEKIEGNNTGTNQEESDAERIKYLIAIGMDTGFWQSPEYLEYYRKKTPEIYSPDAMQVAKDVAPFLEKTNEELSRWVLETCADSIKKGDVYDGISRSIKFLSSEFVLNIPKDEEIKLGFLEDMDSPVVGTTDETAAFFRNENNTIYLTKPLEVYKEKPVDTIALIAHEVFHGYQFHIAKKQMDQPKSKLYAENFTHYIPLADNAEAYLRQLVEAEAYYYQSGIQYQLTSSKEGTAA